MKTADTFGAYHRGWLSGAGWRLWLLAFSLCPFNGVAQSTHSSAWQAQVEVGGWAAGGQVMPFWLRANQWGTVPLSTPAGTLRASVRKFYARPDSGQTGRPRRFDWSVGVEAVGNTAAENRLLLPELYGKVRWHSIEFAAGRWRQLTGLGDSTLSSGFINGSGNAFPIPKVQLATLGYVPLGFTKRFVAINAGYVHGWFTGSYIQHSYLHQKYFYLRLGKPASRIKAHLGINHQVQWAGEADYLKGSQWVAVDGKLPSQFKYYHNVVLATRPASLLGTDYTGFDGTYWFGNGLGSEDLGLELSTSTGTWLLYHQHIYEDLSSLLWINAPDGLTGLSWQRKPSGRFGWLNRVVLEYLSTLDQSGPTFNIPGSNYQGNDNYFNHDQYIQGWSYLGRTIGTPFIMPRNELLPYVRTGQFFSNNRLKMAYLGLMGQAGNRLDWMLRFAYSQNYGTYGAPYAAPIGQFSGLASVNWRLPVLAGTQLMASLATDQGQFLPETVGGYVGLRKIW